MKHAATSVLVIVILVSSLYFLVNNTESLRCSIQNSEVDYANELSAQLANSISYRLHVHEDHIHNLADSLSRVPRAFLTEELMARKQKYMNLKDLFAVNADGTTIPPAKENTWGYLSVYPELSEKTKIFVDPAGNIVFSSPIIYEDGENVVLVGRCSVTAIQQMLHDVDFQDKGVCYIVDNTGTIIIPAKENIPSIRFEDVLAKSVVENVLPASPAAEGENGGLRSGLARIVLGNDAEKQLLVGYDSLGIND